MRLRPMPVVMVSSLTKSGADATLRALELGAFDCIAKPQSLDRDGFDQLLPLVRAAAGSRVRPAFSTPGRPIAANFRPDGRLLAIGSSTGGVEALLTILSKFPANCPPTVITQHMPATFTASFAQRLNRSCAAEVREASEGAALAPGKIYLAPGGETHLEVAGTGPWRCRLIREGTVNGHRPSVDVLFHSVAKAAGERALGVILTGMGKDGARGLLAMRQAGRRRWARMKRAASSMACRASRSRCRRSCGRCRWAAWRTKCWNSATPNMGDGDACRIQSEDPDRRRPAIHAPADPRRLAAIRIQDIRGRGGWRSGAAAADRLSGEFDHQRFQHAQAGRAGAACAPCGYTRPRPKPRSSC